MQKNQKLFDKLKQPDEKLLKEIMAESYQYWDEIKKFLSIEIGETTEEWKFYNQKSGWTLKTFLKKRNLFFFSPLETGFLIGFVFGDKAAGVIAKSKLPKKLINDFLESPKYAEGRGLPIEVHSAKEVEIIKKLVKIKVEN